DEDVVGGDALGGQAAAGGDVDGPAHAGERDTVAGGQRGDAGDAGDDLELELGVDFFQRGEGAVVEAGVAPDQDGPGLPVGEFAGDEGLVDAGAAGAPVLDGGGVGGGGAVAFGVAGLDDPVGGAGVRLDEVAPQPGEVALLLAFVDDEECVGGGDRLGRLEGQVVGVARADPDDQKPPHRIKCARTAHTEMTPAGTTLPKRSLPDGFARLGAAAE